MGNLLAECRRCSIEQCEICPAHVRAPAASGAGVARGTGALNRDAAVGSAAGFGPQQVGNDGGGLGPGRPASGIQPANMSEDAALAEAIRRSALEAGDTVSDDDRDAREARRANEAANARERRSVIEAQDAEYHESLQMDERKEKEKKDKLQKEEEDRRREAQAQAEADQAELKRQENASSQITQARERLPLEPPAETAGRLNILVRVPDGRRLKRAFLATDTVGQIYDFVIVEAGEALATQKFRLVSVQPREIYEDHSATLEASKLQGILLLVEIIEDDD